MTSLCSIDLGGLRPNTIVLGFYDNTTPEDRLRQRSFYKRRWLKSRSASTVEEVMDGSQQNNIPLNSFHDFEISAGLSFARMIFVFDEQIFIHHFRLRFTS